jgi:hypothetical protein
MSLISRAEAEPFGAFKATAVTQEPYPASSWASSRISLGRSCIHTHILLIHRVRG